MATLAELATIVGLREVHPLLSALLKSHGLCLEVGLKFSLLADDDGATCHKLGDADYGRNKGNNQV